MNRIITNILPSLLFFAPLIVVSSFNASAQENSSPVEAVLQKAIDGKTIPAAGVVVVRDGKVIVAKGYGTASIESGTPANENTVFQIASITKQFTAVGILLLAEEGKLNLDDAAGKHLSDVPSQWSEVTLRQLLNQVSGITSYTDVGKIVTDKIYEQAEILALVRELPLRFTPGSRREYSNTNYFLLGMVIEKVSTQPYPKFMEEKIFIPLGMEATRINTSGLKVPNAATGYELKTGKWQTVELVDPSQPFAAGAMLSTAGDMAKWAVAVSQGKLVHKNSWDEAFRLGKLIDGSASNYGFGWQSGKIGETKYMGHGGGIPGFGSYIVRFPIEDIIVVLLSNTTASRAPQQIAFEIAGTFLPNVGDVVAAQNAARNAAPIADSDPDSTTLVRVVFEGMLKGEGDPNLFSPEMQKEMFPDKIKQLKGPLGSQGALTAFDLLASENVGDAKRRSYRATFESGMKIRANITLDSDGKIADAKIRPE